MSQILHRTPTEIQKAGWEALKKQLGLPGALRFLLQYEKGEGDYTKLRKKYFKGKTVKSLVNDMRKERKIGRKEEKGKTYETLKEKARKYGIMLKTMSEVKETGWNALVERLGVAGATLFILEYEKGHGDYTEERKKIFNKKKLDEIVKEIKRK